jgi:tetratricopeptide (TPR) repeat protein
MADSMSEVASISGEPRINGPQLEQNLASVLNYAHSALDAGEVERARDAAQDVLSSAQAQGDTQMEARALLCLAHGDRLISRLQSSAENSRRSSHLFHTLGDIEGEAAALTTLAHVSTSLGHNDEAVEAALLSVRLGTQLPVGIQTVLSHNYLGLAHFWSGNYDDARTAFDTAVELAERCYPPVSAYQPRTNQAWTEAFRLIAERYFNGVSLRPESLQPLVAIWSTVAESEDVMGLLAGSQVTAGTMASLMKALLHCWSGEFEKATAALEAGHQWLNNSISISLV